VGARGDSGDLIGTQLHNERRHREFIQAAMDAFLSHSHRDADFAFRVERALTAEGLTVWVDHHNIRAGGVLIAELQAALQGCRNIVVLWSGDSSESSWVTTEWTSVVGLNQQRETTTKKGVIPCRLDETPLALFLLNYVCCDFRKSFDDGLRDLSASLKRGTVENTPPARPWAPSDFVKEILTRQDSVLGALGTGDVALASRLQSELHLLVDRALREHPADDDILNVAGYDKKNQYMIRHWADVQQGLAPKDALLDQAMEMFLKALSARPDNPSALNGLGSVFILRRDLDAAEFFVSRALARSAEIGLNYGAAEHDLQLIRRVERGSKPLSAARRKPRKTKRTD
jgi:tetratricopeptide (TPR) repeat protein